MKNVAVRTFPRAPAETIKRLHSCGVATTHEAMGRSGLMTPYLRPIQSGVTVSGGAVTALVQPGDNWMIHVAMELCVPGDILVVGVTTENTDGMFGDLLATSAISRGIRALVIDAGVRDVHALRQMGFPVWSRAISARGTVKETLGAVNVPIVCAGASVRAGDVIIADDDGVLVVPREEADPVASAAEERVVKEDALRSRFAGGELSLDVLNLRPKLKQLGFRYVDSLAELGE